MFKLRKVKIISKIHVSLLFHLIWNFMSCVTRKPFIIPCIAEPGFGLPCKVDPDLKQMSDQELQCLPFSLRFSSKVSTRQSDWLTVTSRCVKLFIQQDKASLAACMRPLWSLGFLQKMAFSSCHPEQSHRLIYIFTGHRTPDKFPSNAIQTSSDMKTINLPIGF